MIRRENRRRGNGAREEPERTPERDTGGETPGWETGGDTGETPGRATEAAGGGETGKGGPAEDTGKPRRGPWTEENCRKVPQRALQGILEAHLEPT